MKYSFLILLWGLMWWTPAAAQEANRAAPADTAIVSYSILGMSCPSCAMSVEYALKDVKGIFDYRVNVQKGNARIAYNPTVIHKNEITRALQSTGFSISEMKPEKEKPDES